MSLESVRAFFAEKAPDISVIESPISSATVALAAEAYGVEPGMIAKTLSLRVGERVILIVAAGTSRMDNKKVKAQFGDPQGQRLGDPAGLDAIGFGGQRHRRRADRRFDDGDVGGFFSEEGANRFQAHSSQLIPDLRAGGDA